MHKEKIFNLLKKHLNFQNKYKLMKEQWKLISHLQMMASLNNFTNLIRVKLKCYFLNLLRQSFFGPVCCTRVL